MKIYVDKNEQEFYPDEFVADNTILISEFNEVEVEISHEEVKVKSLQEHDKKIKIEILQQIKEFFIQEDEDCDYTITQDACDIANYLDGLLKELRGE